MMKFAIIGFGGLGKVHYSTIPEVFRRVKDIQLVAICDIDESAFHVQKKINLETDSVDLDLSAYHLYTDVDELLEKEDIDFVITALPTCIHEKIAVKAMEKGIHVFSEKPMALNYEQGVHMLETARKNNVKLMIGQCLRFEAPYVVLKNMILSKEYGEVVFAEFNRISPLVVWSSQNWMLDESKSGGAALDMHVHDVDFIQWMFGTPKAVTSFANNRICKHSTICTTYHYDDKLVISRGDWGMPQCFPFSQEYTVRFERATVILSRSGIKLYPEDGVAIDIPVPVSTHMADEMEDFICCIREDRESQMNPPESSLLSLRIALAEKESADTGKTIAL